MSLQKSTTDESVVTSVHSALHKVEESFVTSALNVHFSLVDCAFAKMVTHWLRVV